MSKREKLFRLSEVLYERDIDTEAKRAALEERRTLRKNLLQQWNDLDAQVRAEQYQQAAFWGAVGSAVGSYYADSYYHGGHGYYYPHHYGWH